MADVQVKKEHYNFSNYMNPNRWMSYYYQIKSADNDNIKTILYIGGGDNIVVDILKKNGKKVFIMDFDPTLNPDIVGSVTDIEKIIGKEQYDLVMCCQVLEHLPFDMFENTVKQLSKVTRQKVIISLPYCTKTMAKVDIWLPKINHMGFHILLPHKYGNRWNIKTDGWGEHYWELGINHDCSRKNVRKILKKYMTLEKEFNPIENIYHVFYVLNK